MNPGPDPVVSVLLPVYNAEDHVDEAIASLLGQSLRELEVVAVDDGSTDSTPERLTAWAARDGRVHVHRRPNGGVSGALNTAIELARAPLLARLDADDAAVADRLERQVARLREEPRLVVVGGAAVFVGRGGRPLATIPYPEHDAEIRASLDAERTPFVHPAVTMRADALRAAGGYRTAVTGAEDYDLWLRIRRLGTLANLPAPVVRYRIHPDQVSTTRLLESSAANAAARAAAERRDRGEPDPLDGADVLDADLLARLGVTPARIADRAVVKATWMARTQAWAGYEGEAEEMWARAREAAAQATRPRMAQAEVLRSRAKAADARGRRGRALRLRVRARLLAAGTG